MRWTDAALGALLLAFATGAQAAPPLSANDWLSGRSAPRAPSSAWRPGDGIPRDVPLPPPPRPTAQPVAQSATPAKVGVTRLDGPDADRAGTLSPARAGLPRDLWANATTAQVTAALVAADPQLPATRDLLVRILLLQADPPDREDSDAGALFLARVDKLLAMGRVTEADALLAAAGPGDAARARRTFDAALLAGDPDRACAALAHVAPDLPARIFCLARAGDWAAADTALHGAEGMGLLDPGQAARLRGFLDDETADTAADLPLPETMTALDLALLSAAGHAQPVSALPLAFAHTALGPDAGLKARLEATERLARVGALPAEAMRGAYIEEPPAASGGVWDRAAVVQTLDAALNAADPAAAAAALPKAFAAFAPAGLLPMLGRMYGVELTQLSLPAAAAQQALWLALLGGVADKASAADDPADVWLLALAQGQALPQQGAPADGVIAAVFTEPPAPAAPEAPGLALLDAIAAVDAGLHGDLVRAASGLAALRALGQDATARQAAIEMVLLPRLGAVTP